MFIFLPLSLWAFIIRVRPPPPEATSGVERAFKSAVRAKLARFANLKPAFRFNKRGVRKARDLHARRHLGGMTSGKVYMTLWCPHIK